MRSLRVLISCEYSGIVRDAFRKQGHDAWSCDILDCDRDDTFHIKGDVLNILNDGWDMMIAHPPCIHLAVSGARHFKEKIADGRQQRALDFVKQLMEAPIEKICVENPVSIISTKIRKPDQIIQPWQFGDPFQKTTCLWLKNLPKLKHTKIVDKGEFYVSPSGKKLPKWYNATTVKGNRAKSRSKTFEGIANAMAAQWSNQYAIIPLRKEEQHVKPIPDQSPTHHRS